MDILQLLFQIINKKEEIDTNYNEILLPEIPFYGISGSICRIEEAEESYYKVLYNHDGTINKTKIPVPKKKNKNFNLIIKDYYEDLKQYLDIFENTYLEYETNNITKILTNKQYYCLLIVTFLASLLSIPFLFTTSIIGVIFGSISIFSLYLVYDIHKKDEEKINIRNTFKNNYKQLQNNLVEYKNGNIKYKEKQKETIYTEIKKLEKNNLKIFPKLNILTKEEI